MNAHIRELKGFRHLDKQEINTVSGGSDPYDPIVVTGETIAMHGLFAGLSVVPDNILIPELQKTEIGETNYNSAICGLEQQEEQTDFLASLVESLIKQQADSNEREYGALIYYDTSGQLKIGSLTPGTTVAEARAVGDVAPSVGFAVPNDLGPGGIVAAVHNHPDVGYSNSEDIINNYPSYNGPNDDSDYRTFEGLVGIDDRFASGGIFSLYILGADGVLREFDLKDGRLSAANDPDPDSRDDLYEPDPQCPQTGSGL